MSFSATLNFGVYFKMLFIQNQSEMIQFFLCAELFTVILQFCYEW